MGSYLDDYGAGEERRQRIIMSSIIALSIVLVLGFSIFLFLKNFREKAVARKFLSEVNAGQYEAAYRSWGCSSSHPCPEYSYQKFLEDWGGHQQPANWSIQAVDGCRSGVVITVAAPGVDAQSLWVQRSDKSLSFSPWPECPGPKWRFGQFFDRFFGSQPTPQPPPSPGAR